MKLDNSKLNQISQEEIEEVKEEVNEKPIENGANKVDAVNGITKEEEIQKVYNALNQVLELKKEEVENLPAHLSCNDRKKALKAIYGENENKTNDEKLEGLVQEINKIKNDDKQWNESRSKEEAAMILIDVLRKTDTEENQKYIEKLEDDLLDVRMSMWNNTELEKEIKKYEDLKVDGEKNGEEWPEKWDKEYNKLQKELLNRELKEKQEALGKLGGWNGEADEMQDIEDMEEYQRLSGEISVLQEKIKALGETKEEPRQKQQEVKKEEAINTNTQTEEVKEESIDTNTQAEEISESVDSVKEEEKQPELSSEEMLADNEKLRREMEAKEYLKHINDMYSPKAIEEKIKKQEEIEANKGVVEDEDRAFWQQDLENYNKVFSPAEQDAIFEAARKRSNEAMNEAMGVSNKTKKEKESDKMESELNNLGAKVIDSDTNKGSAKIEKENKKINKSKEELISELEPELVEILKVHIQNSKIDTQNPDKSIQDLTSQISNEINKNKKDLTKEMSLEIATALINNNINSLPEKVESLNNKNEKAKKDKISKNKEENKKPKSGLFAFLGNIFGGSKKEEKLQKERIEEINKEEESIKNNGNILLYTEEKRIDELEKEKAKLNELEKENVENIEDNKKDKSPKNKEENKKTKSGLFAFLGGLFGGNKKEEKPQEKRIEEIDKRKELDKEADNIQIQLDKYSYSEGEEISEDEQKQISDLRKRLEEIEKEKAELLHIEEINKRKELDKEADNIQTQLDKYSYSEGEEISEDEQKQISDLRKRLEEIEKEKAKLLHNK